jgi:hypothetical protein
VFYFPAVLLLIPNISSSVNWGVPHGLHKIAPVSLSLTASIYRAHKLAYVPSLLFYTPWFAIEEYSDVAGNSATCYVHFDWSAYQAGIKQCVQR